MAPLGKDRIILVRRPTSITVVDRQPTIGLVALPIIARDTRHGALDIAHGQVTGHSYANRKETHTVFEFTSRTTTELTYRHGCFGTSNLCSD